MLSFLLSKYWSLAFSLFYSPSTPPVSKGHKIILDTFVFNINNFILHGPNTGSMVIIIVLYITKDLNSFISQYFLSYWLFS